jgi:hypothetical protein
VRWCTVDDRALEEAVVRARMGLLLVGVKLLIVRVGDEYSMLIFYPCALEIESTTNNGYHSTKILRGVLVASRLASRSHILLIDTHVAIMISRRNARTVCLKLEKNQPLPFQWELVGEEYRKLDILERPGRHPSRL